MLRGFSVSQGKPSLSFILLLVMLFVLGVAGGASRPDEMGQVVVRACAGCLIIIAIMFGPRLELNKVKAVAILFACATLLVLVQLIPLPPSVWCALPGREVLAGAPMFSGGPQPWRPLAIVPSATLNAAMSLIVPGSILVFMAGLKEQEHHWLLKFILGLIMFATVLALLQFSGAGFDNPLINDDRSEVSGFFANRNHFALFVAFGLLLGPAWAFLGRRGSGKRGLIAVGLILIFTLTILASGSRAGILVGLLALTIGPIIVRNEIRRVIYFYPRWLFPMIAVAIVVLITAFIFTSFEANRAVAINRALAMGAGEDFRSLALPTLIKMLRIYFPIGYGFGGFDPVFRIHEPLALLDTTYFNHAHNDWLEISLEAGLPGILLLFSSFIWWLTQSVHAWRSTERTYCAFPQLGSAMLMLVMTASVFDYPARTPLIMAFIMIAAIWLNRSAKERLPREAEPL